MERRQLARGGEAVRGARLAGLATLAAVVVVGPAADLRADGGRGPAAGSYREESFSTDPGWLGVGNRPGTKPCTTRSFGFGWRPGDKRKAPSIGGTLERSSNYRAYYAKVLPGTVDLDDHLIASGTLSIGGGSSTAGALFGWFDAGSSYDWRTTNTLVIRLDAAKKGYAYAELGTADTFAATAKVAKGLDQKKWYDWALEYLPDAGATGSGLIRLTVGGSTAEVSLTPAQRADGATFDRFGLLDVQLAGSTATASFANLTLDGVPIDLGSDPGWEASKNNLKQAVDCFVHGRQDFGYSGGTTVAGGEPGEIGGLMWRTERKVASYADRTGDLGLDDPLYAEGSIVLDRASTDSDLFIGWFNAASAAEPGRSVPTDIVAAELGGPSEWGYRLYPVYRAGGARGTYPSPKDAPLVTSKGRVFKWWICLAPAVDADGNGRLTVGLVDPAQPAAAETASMPVSATAGAAGPVLNRFGIRNLERGGHSVVVHLDDLRYTVGPGDAPPPGRC